MPRIARVVLPGVPHHITQRGVNRSQVFFTDVDRRIYLDLVREHAGHAGVSLAGYCLMPNHAHWIAVPDEEDSLAKVFGRTHYRYALYLNASRGRSGHLWQNRFFSCPLDPSHLWAALRYVERNPVRAGLAASAEEWPWSSAVVHAGLVPPPSWLDLSEWSTAFTAAEWRLNLAASTLGEAEILLRKHTYVGRPLGPPRFIEAAEKQLRRPLTPGKGGRPRKLPAEIVPPAGVQYLPF